MVTRAMGKRTEPGMRNWGCQVWGKFTILSRIMRVMKESIKEKVTCLQKLKEFREQATCGKRLRAENRQCKGPEANNTPWNI